MLDTGATANLVCFSWIARQNRALARRGIPRVRFVGGYRSEVCRAAYIPVGVAGNWGMLVAFVTGAEIPALLRKGAMEAPGWRLDFLRGPLTLRRQGVQIPLRMNRVGRDILSAVDSRGDPSGRAPKRPEAAASFFRLVQKFPDLSDGGLHLSYMPGGLYRFETPLAFPPCKAFSLGDAREGSLTGPEKIAT